MARRSRYIRASLLGLIGWRASSGRGRRRLALAPEQLALRLALLAHFEADGVVRWHSVAVHRLHSHVDHIPAPFVVVLHDLPLLENVVRRYRRWLDTARRAVASCRAAASVLSEAAAAPPICWLLDPAPLARSLLRAASEEARLHPLSSRRRSLSCLLLLVGSLPADHLRPRGLLGGRGRLTRTLLHSLPVPITNWNTKTGSHYATPEPWPGL